MSHSPLNKNTNAVPLEVQTSTRAAASKKSQFQLSGNRNALLIPTVTLQNSFLLLKKTNASLVFKLHLQQMNSYKKKATLKQHFDFPLSIKCPAVVRRSAHDPLLKRLCKGLDVGRTTLLASCTHREIKKTSHAKSTLLGKIWSASHSSRDCMILTPIEKRIHYFSVTA